MLEIERNYMKKPLVLIMAAMLSICFNTYADNDDDSWHYSIQNNSSVNYKVRIVALPTWTYPLKDNTSIPADQMALKMAGSCTVGAQVGAGIICALGFLLPDNSGDAFMTLKLSDDNGLLGEIGKYMQGTKNSQTLDDNGYTLNAGKSCSLYTEYSYDSGTFTDTVDNAAENPRVTVAIYLIPESDYQEGVKPSNYFCTQIVWKYNGMLSHDKAYYTSNNGTYGGSLNQRVAINNTKREDHYTFNITINNFVDPADMPLFGSATPEKEGDL